MKKIFSIILKVLGFLFIMAALLCSWGAVNSYITRAEHGAGLMFADAEIFCTLNHFFSLCGFASLWIRRKLHK